MKRTILTLTLAAQLAAGTAFAQTTTTDAQTGDMATGTQTFGSDWPTTLGLALFEEDGSTVRAESEITTQWETLSDEDKEMIRRDCGMIGEEADATDAGAMGDDAMADDAMGDDAMADTATDDMAAGSADVGAASGEEGADITAEVQAETDTAATDSVMAEDSATTPLTVSAEQLEEICAVTDTLE